MRYFRKSALVLFSTVLGVLLIFKFALASTDYIVTDDFDMRFQNDSYFAQAGNVAYGDLNEDGEMDLVVGGGSLVTVYFSVEDLSGLDVDVTDNSQYSLQFTAPIPWGFSLLVEDVNGDGYDDLILNDSLSSADVYVIFSSLIKTFTLGSQYNLTTPGNYSVRYLTTMWGGDESAQILVRDINNDNEGDLILNADGDDASAGAIYIIYSDEVAGQSGSLTLNDSSTYNIKIGGPASNSIGDGGMIQIEDVTGDNKNDIVVASDYSNGAIWVIGNNKLGGLSGLGNTLSLTNTSDYNFSFVGSATVQLGNHDAFSILLDDIDNNGVSDLIFDTEETFYVSNRCSLFIVSDTTLASYQDVANGSQFDISSDTDKYILNIEGALADWGFGTEQGIATGDFDSDGLQDLVIVADYSNNAYASAGSVYIISGDILADSFGAGNLLDLNTGNDNFTLRLDGPHADSAIGSNFNAGTPLIVFDYDGNGVEDLIFGGSYIDTPSSTDAGGMWVFFDSFLESYFNSTENVLDLANSSSYSEFYDGGTNGDFLRYSILDRFDVNQDGIMDLFAPHPYDWQLLIHYGGGLLSSVPMGMSTALTSDASIDPSAVRQGGTKTVRLSSSGLTLADIDVSFTQRSAYGWSGITGSANTTSGKSFVHNLVSAPGTGSSYTLYVPKLSGSNRVRVCPGATSLGQVTETCVGGTTYAQGQNGVTTVTISSQSYWRIPNQTNTGGMNLTVVSPTATPTPTPTQTQTPSATPTSIAATPTPIPDTSPPDFNLLKIGTVDYNPLYNLYYYTGLEPLFVGSGEVGSVVTMTVDYIVHPTTDTINTQGNWSIGDYAFVPGSHTVQFSAQDSSGNETLISFTLVIDPNWGTTMVSPTPEPTSMPGTTEISPTPQLTPTTVPTPEPTTIDRGPGTLLIRVFTDEHMPIPNAAVVISRDSQETSLQTDTNGEIMLNDIEAGIYTISAKKDEFEVRKTIQILKSNEAYVVEMIIGDYIDVGDVKVAHWVKTITQNIENIPVVGQPLEKILIVIIKAADIPTLTVGTMSVTGLGLGLPYLQFLLQTILLLIQYVPLSRIPGLLLGLFVPRKNPWGVVYDSQRKEPIDPALVTLTDSNGVERYSVTDFYGRYTFLVNEGTYRMRAEKSNYQFPAKTLENKTVDLPYDDLYFGEEFSVTSDQSIT
ncbi:FG-GAP repeat protein, partial [candidate division WWE3 bacterium]|nr:FG-GAP repeat protein [candidate division WWE3 bacterium]